MDLQSQLELHYTQQRDRLFQLLETSSGMSWDALSLISASLRTISNISDLGLHFWALMRKTDGFKLGVKGFHFKVYMQYFYFYLIQRSQRTIAEQTRILAFEDLAFITCVASFGWDRGCKEFENAARTKNVALVNDAVVERPAFLKFCWDGSDDKFSFIASWKLIDQLWEFWDTAPPRIHGFTSPAIGEFVLKSRIHLPGTFFLRFSSRGGLAVDFVRAGRVEKTHWKAADLSSTRDLKVKMYDKNRDGINCLQVADPSDPIGAPTRTIPREVAFPLDARDRGYVNLDSLPASMDEPNPYATIEGYENVVEGRVLSMSGFININGGSFDGSLYSSYA